MKTILRRILPATGTALATLLWAKAEHPLLRAHGYSRSLKSRRPVDEQGRPIPWIPYCVVALLQERLRAHMNVLEFGAGFSTLFFMTRVAKVVSIEHQATWLGLLRQQIAANVVLTHAASGSEQEYCAAAAAGAGEAPYDLILIDGIHRVACFRTALDLLSETGVIILDDSERAEYREIFEIAGARALRALTLHGHKAGSAGLHWSTIFYRGRNCLEI